MNFRSARIRPSHDRSLFEGPGELLREYNIVEFGTGKCQITWTTLGEDAVEAIGNSPIFDNKVSAYCWLKNHIELWF